MRTSAPITFRLLGVVIATAALSSQAAIFTTDFNSGLPAGTAIYNGSVGGPGPSITSNGGVGDSGVLRLTEAVGSQQGSFVIDDFNGGVAVNGFVAHYKVRVGGGNGADGYSFVFGSDIPNSSWGEEGVGAGLIVAFDTYANPGETPNTVEIKYGGVSVAQTIFNFTTGSGFADVTITLCPNGRVTVAQGTQTIFDRVQVSYAPIVGRFGFGARTGGATDNHFIDDLTIDTTDPGATAITSQPTNQAISQGQAAIFTVGVNGICYNSVQWFSNNVAIPDGTSLIYSTPPATLEMNNTVYRAEITDNFGTLISDNATLTVAPAPIIFGVSSRRNPYGVFVFFNKNVASASALNPANYQILSGGISVTGAVYNSFIATNGERTVVMIQVTPALTGGQTYTLRVGNVLDDDGNPLLPNPTDVSFTHLGGSICYDFNSGLPAGSSVYGSARVDSIGGVQNSGALKLSDAMLNQSGAFRVHDLSPSAPVTKFHASFMMRIDTPLANNPADGMSFNIASDLPAGTYGVAEEGQGSGLIVSFDNWDAAGENAPAVDIKWNGQIVPGGHRAIAKHNFPAYIPMVLDMSPDGVLNVQWNGTNLFQNLQIPFTPISNAKLGFAGRTGGAFENHWVDDVCVTLFNGGPIGFSQPLANQTVTEARPYTFRLNVDGTPPYFIQWFSNGVEIAGANTETLSGIATLDANNAQFSAIVSNEFSSATSATATLTVQADNAAPQVVSAKANRGLNMITIVFNEALDPVTATDPANASLNGSATIIDRYLTNNGTTLVLITSPQTPGDTYSLELNFIYDVTLKPENYISASVPVVSWIITPGFVQMDLYKEIYGTLVTDLTGNSKFPNRPDATSYSHLTDWRQPQTGNLTRSQDEPWNNYGGRMSGFFTPRVTGSHRFYFTHDDEAQFRMSTDANPANATVLVTALGVRNLPYADFTPQFVDVAGLTAGQRYYFEALFKEGGGGDYLSIGVREPGNNIGTNGITTIQNYSLAALADPSAAPALSISQQPVDATVEAGHSATFTVGASYSGNNLPFYQWNIGGTPVAGANGPTFVTPPAALDEVVSVDIYLPGVKVTSATVNLHVVPDTTGPQITGSVVLNGNSVSVGFGEPITIDSPATLTDPNNYRVNDSAIVTAVTVMNPSSVRLTVSGTLSGTTTVRAGTAIKDAAGNAVAEGNLPGYSAPFTSIPVKTWTDINSPLPAGTVFTVNNRDFVVTAGGADVWSGGDQFTYIYEQRTGDFDVKVRVDRIDRVGDDNSKAGLNIRDSLDGSAANAARMAWVFPTPTNGNASFQTAIRPEPGRDVIDVNGGSYGRWGRGMGSPWVRVKRVGKSFTYYNSYDGLNWNPIGLPRVADANPENGIGGLGLAIADAINFPDTLYVGLGTVSHVQNTATTANMAEYGDWSYPGASATVTLNPQNTLGYVGGTTKFTASGLVNGAPQHELIVQWQKNGVDIPGAVSTYVDNYAYTTPPITTDDNGAQYRAALIVPGATRVFTTAATLSVAANSDATPLQVVAARRDPTDANKVILTFNKLLRPSSVTPTGNYTIDQGVAVLSAERKGTRKVVLTTSGLAPLSNCVSYAISISGVQDGNGTAMATANTTIPGSPAARVLFITGNAVGMNLSDRFMIDRMEGMGYEVLPISATAANRRGVSAANGMSVIFLASPGGTTVGSVFRAAPVPTIVCRRDLFDDYDFVPNNSLGTVAAHFDLNIVDAAHPLAGGLAAGIRTVVDTALAANRTFNWASNLAPSAQIIARINGGATNTQPAIFGFENGAALLNGRSATSRRVGTYFEDNVAQFWNANGKALFDAMLNWVSIPAIMQQPQNLTINQGSSGTLCVVAGSLGSPTYQWYRNGTAISGATGERYVINNAQAGNAGSYTVVITNPSGSITSAVANVTVTAPPPPGLIISKSGAGVISLSWTNGGTLEEAREIVGPWQTAGNQANPQTVSQEGYLVYLTPGQEAVNPGTRSGIGNGTIALSGNTLTVSITFSGLSGTWTADHIHGPAARGANANVLYGLQSITTLNPGNTSGTISGTVTLTNGALGFTLAQQLDQLRGGQWYVNIHSSTFAGGEIRGQIDPVVFGASLDPRQEVGGPGARTGSGLGVVALNGNAVTFNASFSGLSGTWTADHFHGPAARGVNANVLYNLGAFTTLNAGNTSGTIIGTITLTDGVQGYTAAQQLQQLLDGQWYLNVHSSTFSGGEVRGQVEKPVKLFFRVRQ